MAELIYVSTVREMRKSHRHAAVGLLMNMLQAVMLVGIFLLMFSILGMRGAALRGDFLLYIMSGIFLFMTHTKTLGAVLGSDGPTSPMLLHEPLNTHISIIAAALAALYMQILSLCIILFAYHSLWTPITIDQPVNALAMVIGAWFFGVAIGLLLLGLKPWYPGLVGFISQLWRRANMIASGKMFVANSLPASMLAMFDWNPLFHLIDQNRGFVFLHYSPHNSSVSYPFLVSLVLIVIGFMGESFTRKHASSSWEATR